MAGVSVTDFLSKVRRSAMIPTNARAFQDSDILSVANDELRSYITPILLKAREEYLVHTADLTVDTENDLVRIPSNAVGRKLKQVLVSCGDRYQDLPRLDSDLPSHADIGFTLEASNILLWNVSATSVRVKFFRAPGDLDSTNAGTVSLATTVNGASVSTTMPRAAGDVVEVVSRVDPTVVKVTFTVAAVSGGGLVLSSGSVAVPPLAVGDYVLTAGTANYVQLPDEVVPLLISRTALRYLEAVGDPKITVTKALCEEMEKNVFPTLSPRVEGSPRVIVNRRGPGF